MEHISLAELNSRIEGALKEKLEASYWIVAEIGDMKINQKGHCYLELIEKDGDEVRARLRGTIWAFTYRNLNTWFERFTGKPLETGMKILFNGTVQYHTLYGLSINIRDIDAKYTLGERAKKRKEVVRRLEEEGVFAMNRDVALPAVPQRIAVISSSTAAGWGDFENQLNKNPWGYRVQAKLFPAVVQGEAAAGSITEAMHKIFAIADHFDLLVIIRGGGATLDLDCFDTYQVASHICQFPLPVVTGIGHQRDETVSDMVAHTSLSTPTGVAEFILSGIRSFDERLQLATERLHDQIDRFGDKHVHHLHLLARRLTQSHIIALNKKQIDLNGMLYRLKTTAPSLIDKNSNQIERLGHELLRAARMSLEKAQDGLSTYEKTLEHLDPARVFERGFTLTLLEDKLLRDVQYTPVGSIIRTIDKKHDIESRVVSAKSDQAYGQKTF